MKKKKKKTFTLSSNFRLRNEFFLALLTSHRAFCTSCHRQPSKKKKGKVENNYLTTVYATVVIFRYEGTNSE